MVGLESASDSQVWEYAKLNDYVIVTRDADFEELSIVWGQPPKVIWLKTANGSKTFVQQLLVDHLESIILATHENDYACLEITA